MAASRRAAAISPPPGRDWTWITPRDAVRAAQTGADLGGLAQPAPRETAPEPPEVRAGIIDDDAEFLADLESPWTGV
jgi:hypothetical protein